MLGGPAEPPVTTASKELSSAAAAETAAGKAPLAAELPLEAPLFAGEEAPVAETPLWGSLTPEGPSAGP
eukprot:scaffold208972_cov15-Prasinocladus_malaysianus.AAC.1